VVAAKLSPRLRARLRGPKTLAPNALALRCANYFGAEVRV